MIELLGHNIQTMDRHSSKGNQLKWLSENFWYKADYTGYEGLAEYTVSNLLTLSNLKSEEYILYHTEEILYKHTKYLGCASKNFLPKGWQLITLERLFQHTYGESLIKSIYKISDKKERLRFLVEQTIRITGLKEFGSYISKMLTLDAFFLNEDRHTHNIAVLLDPEGTYHYCPFFDHGAALLSDTTMDYPLDAEIPLLLKEVEAKTFSSDFDEQLDIAEELYGRHVHFSFDTKNVEQLLEEEKHYPKELKTRDMDILHIQIRKYQYLF